MSDQSASAEDLARLEQLKTKYLSEEELTDEEEEFLEKMADDPEANIQFADDDTE